MREYRTYDAINPTPLTAKLVDRIYLAVKTYKTVSACDFNGKNCTALCGNDVVCPLMLVTIDKHLPKITVEY